MDAYDDYVWDAAIVGGGPAGTAAAIRMLQAAPWLSGRILVLERVAFPRSKLCGGGILRGAENALRRLGVDASDLLSPVTSVCFQTESRTLTLRAGRVVGPHVFQVANRYHFDHRLIEYAIARGASLIQASVIGVQVHPDLAVLETSIGRIGTRVVVAADGANSLVARRLGLRSKHNLGAACEARVPVAPIRSGARPGDLGAVLDFTAVSRACSGYYWEFPFPGSGPCDISAGIADTRLSPVRGANPLASQLVAAGRERDRLIPRRDIRGAAMRSYDPAAPASAPRVLLTGDALGCEPFFAEGIGSALESGIFAGDAAVGALLHGDFRFNSYDTLLRRSSFGRAMKMKGVLARRFHGSPRDWKLVVGAWGSRRAARLFSQGGSW